MMTDRKIIASAEVVSEILGRLNASAAIIYLMVLGHRNGRTGECYVTQTTIAEETSLSDRSVRTALNKLKEAGYLDWKQGSSFSSKANSYIFLKEVFDSEGKGAALEAKKLKSKNKEQKIVENAKKKNECKIVQMAVAKVPSGPTPKPSFLDSKIVNMNKIAPATQTVNPAAAKKEKVKMPAEVKSLSNEYKNLLNKRNEMIKNKENHWKDTYSGVVKNYIEKGDTKMASYVLKEGIRELQKNFYIQENGLNKLKDRDADKVYTTFEQEFTNDFKSRISAYKMMNYSSASIVAEIKFFIEDKGLEFNLNKILSA